MADPKLPYIKLYSGDWLKDNISGCSLEAQGLWLRMMFIMHDSKPYGFLVLNGKPMPPEMVARRCGCDLGRYMELLTELTSAGVPSKTENFSLNFGSHLVHLDDHILYSRRMVLDANLRQIRVKIGKRGGERSGKSRRKSLWITRSKIEANGQAKVNQNPEHEHEHHVVVKSVVGRDSLKGGQPEAYVRKTDPVSRVIYAYKQMKGFEIDDRAWDKVDWARAAKTAPKILELAEGDADTAVKYVQSFGSWAEKRKINFTIETLVKCYNEWRSTSGH